MSEIINSNVSDRICKHMNEDHSDAILLYAKFYGNMSEVEKAKMLSIDSEGMNLSVNVKDSNQKIRIKFDHSLEDAEDAHHTLIDMVKKARTNSQG
jgi:putative heme iron utilization protein